MKSYLLQEDQKTVHVAGINSDGEIVTVCGLYLTKNPDGSFKGPLEELYEVKKGTEPSCEYCRGGIRDVINLADIETLKSWAQKSS